jgi:hypothetical protein
MALQSPEEILLEVHEIRAHVVLEMEKASRGPRGGRLPRGVRAPATIAEGLAWVQGRIDADFMLPPLDYYFAAMRRLEVRNIPTWKGEPENELESLETLDAIIACCEQAIQQQTNQTGPQQHLSRDGSHSPDFRSVRWFGIVYAFTPMQAACVQVLWQAWEHGAPELSQAAILEAAGSAGARLRDVFDMGKTKGQHSSWGRMIVSGNTKGSFRLAPHST